MTSSSALDLGTSIPDRIGGLSDLALNLWWSWNSEAVDLFRVIDPATWLLADRNAVRFLKIVSPVYLERVSQDPEYLAEYDRVMQQFRIETDPGSEDTWIARTQPELRHRPMAYFSAEFGLHPTLPIYSGGLGVLAGDHIKSASDLGIPLSAVSLFYRQGYLRQRLDENGWQLNVPAVIDPEFEPATPVLDEQGGQLRVEVALDDPASPLELAVWRVRVGRVDLYLLDSDVESFPDETRDLSSRLYGGDIEHRLRQEILLGIGGVRALRALGLNISYWHGNEGHAAFHLLERCRMLVVEQGMSFDQAAAVVRSSSVFTTHTPVPAGHDHFRPELMDKYFGHYWPELGLSRDEFLDLGKYELTGDEFNMTALSFRLSDIRNGVSKTHGDVTRQMWSDLWPDVPVEDMPVTSITNGVHVPTWTGRHMAQLYSEWLPEGWRSTTDKPTVWNHIWEIPDPLYWNRRRRSKQSLLRYLREQSRRRWIGGTSKKSNLLSAGPFLEPGALTLGFARRFATYKRATLIFHDPDRLAAILTNPERPVQIIFAGKAHPADEAGKAMIQDIMMRAQDPLFGGRIAFAEDYDMVLASYLVSGVDVWLNNPVYPMEASGTSGMKAGINGVPNLSILDGWWVEGWADDNSRGWGLEGSQADDPAQRDAEDAGHIYDTLENEVVPLYYDRPADGIPHEWIRVAKEITCAVAPEFSSRRMVKEYAERLYLPAAVGTQHPQE